MTTFIGGLLLSLACSVATAGFIRHSQITDPDIYYKDGNPDGKIPNFDWKDYTLSVIWPGYWLLAALAIILNRRGIG